MEGGSIVGNESQWGGGVHVYRGTFNMSGGTIRSNTSIKADTSGASSRHGGGGVSVDSPSSVFTMSGTAVISDNTAVSYGGGVNVGWGATFIMEGGTISSNTAGEGGGVFAYQGNSNITRFTMEGGTISGNTVATYGGGVSVWTATFTKTGSSIIYGGNASTDAEKNIVGARDTTDKVTVVGDLMPGLGHAVYVNTAKKRDNTADENYNLDSTKAKADGGGWD
jgi:hypothetical protein